MLAFLAECEAESNQINFHWKSSRPYGASRQLAKSTGLMKQLQLYAQA